MARHTALDMLTDPYIRMDPSTAKARQMQTDLSLVLEHMMAHSAIPPAPIEMNDPRPPGGDPLHDVTQPVPEDLQPWEWIDARNKP